MICWFYCFDCCTVTVMAVKGPIQIGGLKGAGLGPSCYCSVVDTHVGSSLYCFAENFVTTLWWEGMRNDEHYHPLLARLRNSLWYPICLSNDSLSRLKPSPIYRISQSRDRPPVFNHKESRTTTRTTIRQGLRVDLVILDFIIILIVNILILIIYQDFTS